MKDIAYKLANDVDVLKYLAINLTGIAASLTLENISTLVSIGATVLSCAGGLVLVYYKVREARKRGE